MDHDPRANLLKLYDDLQRKVCYAGIALADSEYGSLRHWLAAIADVVEDAKGEAEYIRKLGAT